LRSDDIADIVGDVDRPSKRSRDGIHGPEIEQSWPRHHDDIAGHCAKSFAREMP
jgi:hypothetical protein